jgi:hypothetical protein
MGQTLCYPDKRDDKADSLVAEIVANKQQEEKDAAAAKQRAPTTSTAPAAAAPTSTDAKPAAN